MKMNNHPKWLKKMADAEDGCDVSLGGMEHAKLLERLCTPGTSPPEDDVRLTFEKWMQELDKLGVAERIFDAADAYYLCPGSKPRRPYAGDDGLFFQCFQSGMTPRQALGEACVEQDLA